MKKAIFTLIIIFSLMSCGSDKKKADVETEEKKEVVKYSMEIDAIYEKDDSLTVVYQLDNIMQYEKPIYQKVEGSPMPQKIIFNFPEGEYPENLNITVSSNKEQSHVTIKNVTIKIGDKTIDGSNYKFIDYFLTDVSFSWDLEKSRYNLTHTNKYPPALVGNEKLLSLMIQ
jgi:hypothetical protein